MKKQANYGAVGTWQKWRLNMERTGLIMGILKAVSDITIGRIVRDFDAAFLSPKSAKNAVMYQGAENTHPHCAPFRYKGMQRDVLGGDAEE